MHGLEQQVRVLVIGNGAAGAENQAMVRPFIPS
jgi:hypothetical protein